MTKKELQQENNELKIIIEELEKRLERLEFKNNELLKVTAMGRRGLPWS
jgi:predicted RNase H-like nuclease (RuvC/YqgF family)